MVSHLNRYFTKDNLINMKTKLVTFFEKETPSLEKYNFLNYEALLDQITNRKYIKQFLLCTMKKREWWRGEGGGGESNGGA